MKPRPGLFVFMTLFAALAAIVATALLVLPVAYSAEPPAAAAAMPADVWSWGLFSAALATGLSSLGAGFAVARLVHGRLHGTVRGHAGACARQAISRRVRFVPDVGDARRHSRRFRMRIETMRP